jgi:uncharacterized protein (TIGR03089 family)
MSPEESFGRLLAADPGRPFVTYYDEASGERTELSVRSLANWVAKTHHLLIDELGLRPGDAAQIALPAHWISVPVLLGCLSAGLALSPDAGDAAVAFVAPGTAPDADGVPDIYAVNPSAAAIGFRDCAPAGCQDYVTSVRPHADAWPGTGQWAGAGDPCLPGLSRAETGERGAQRAAGLGLATGGRLLSTRYWHGPDDWVDTLLAPLAVGASVVYVRNLPDGPDGEAILERRAQQERTTATLR